jgi:hypothetical protein
MNFYLKTGRMTLTTTWMMTNRRRRTMRRRKSKTTGISRIVVSCTMPITRETILQMTFLFRIE